MANPHLNGVRSNTLYSRSATSLTVPTGVTLTIADADKLVVGSNPTVNQIEVSFVGQTTEAAVDRAFFVANRAYIVTAIRQSHGVAAGGASTLQVTKDTGTTAPGAGTDLLSAAFDLNGTANTVQTGALSATPADLTLAAGDRLSIDFANTIQSTAGLVVTVALKPV